MNTQSLLAMNRYPRLLKRSLHTTSSLKYALPQHTVKSEAVPSFENAALMFKSLLYSVMIKKCRALSNILQSDFEKYCATVPGYHWFAYSRACCSRDSNGVTILRRLVWTPGEYCTQYDIHLETRWDK